MKTKLSRWVWVTGVLAGMASGVLAQEVREPQRLLVDLNGDAVREEIVMRRSGKDADLGEFFQVLARRADGTVLWSSSATMDANDPLAFGRWDFGISLPQWAGDIDADGKIEMIAPAPQSDVSPTFFRVFRWTGQSFEPLFSRALTGGIENGARYAWSENPPETGYWVAEWIGASAEGGMVVRVMSYDGGSSVLHGLAVLTPEAGAFTLERWIQSPSAVSADAGDVEDGDGGPLSYLARLSARDHQNSSGEQLKTVVDILRQDRANKQRGTTADGEDEGCSLFTSAESRAQMPAMRAVVKGGATATARILNGTPLVRVTVSGEELQVEVIDE
ncbi:MAG: hypothetical protein KDK97_08075 [Verrucomicrobiales bacterium]|nr:hypothetical protein [Verrucomicrobiales bacterium]MCP5557027.1 hypothetical protein [Verrucomicrobiaceae bacterium]